MKKLLVSIAILGAALTAHSQEAIWKFTYDVSFPFSQTREFTDQVSWRGLGLDLDRLLNDNLAVGVGVGWHAFVQKYPDSYYENDGMLLHGTQMRYINDIPITGRLTWFQPMDMVEPYVTLGIGTVWQEMRREIGLLAFSGSYWQFVLAPELGMIIPLGFQSYGTLKVKYTHGFPTGENENSLSYLSVGVGVAW